MAIVNITYDTDNNKEIVCTIDGQLVSDVQAVRLYKYDDKVDLSMDLVSKQSNGLTVYRSVCAAEKADPTHDKIAILGQKNELAITQAKQSPFAKSVAAMFKR